jgi:hypothetical protein
VEAAKAFVLELHERGDRPKNARQVGAKIEEATGIAVSRQGTSKLLREDLGAKYRKTRKRHPE